MTDQNGPVERPVERPAERTRDHALSFAAVADAYDRARPSYPEEAVAWLVGRQPATVVELGAGTGKLTELLVAAGHDVLATDPLPEMLAHLRRRLPDVRTALASAEEIPVPSRSVDVVVCAQSFHWFDHDVALPEIARVLRPGGRIALVWNHRDTGIPWVRRLERIIGEKDERDQNVRPLMETPHFGWVEEQEFRFWQSLDADLLADLVRSRSYIAVLPEERRAGVLAQVRALYDDYGRGPDGMLLPYLTACYRATVVHREPPPQAEVEDPPTDTNGPNGGPDDGGDDEGPDDGALLIDFR
ncbi:MAG TPA: class I SAM-dependent methyltransferase [Marmoricola sp.]|nr:class I SAM-dependent methyltransferase [Marmoricola sp.]